MSTTHGAVKTRCHEDTTDDVYLVRAGCVVCAQVRMGLGSGSKVWNPGTWIRCVLHPPTPAIFKIGIGVIGGPWNSDSLHHLTRQWSDKISTKLKLQNQYKSWYGRLRGDEKLRLLAANPAISIIMQLITLPKEVVAKQDSTTAFSTLLTL
jgi:hypothetical protein